MRWANVRVDKDLTARVMDRYGLRTEPEAVDFALRSVAGHYDPEELLKLKGIGWEGDLQKMRGTRYPKI